MIQQSELQSFVESRLDGTDYFLVDVTVSPDNDIVVDIDSPHDVDIDFCADLSRAIEEAFPRDEVEDYSLEVGSAGLTAPFKVLGQYLKNVGYEVEVLTADGRKLRGTLMGADAHGFTLQVMTKVKEEGKKRPVLTPVDEHFAYTDVRQVKAVI